MRSLSRIITILLLINFLPYAHSKTLDYSCCGSAGGINYCDVSAGRYICKNGDFSTCYCTRHAVMDLNLFEGCCVWKGGVFKNDLVQGLVICNNGGISDNCSKQKTVKAISYY